MINEDAICKRLFKIALVLVGLGMWLLPSRTIDISKTDQTPQISSVKAQITAYTSSEEETDEEPLISASGREVFRGMAACPEWLAFGTEIEIEGKRYWCFDRMAKRFRDGHYFDIWHPNTASAKEYGRQTKEVFIKKLLTVEAFTEPLK